MFARQRLCSLVYVAALAILPLLGLPEVVAQPSQTKPVLVVSFSGLDRLWEDADFLGKLAGVSNLSDNVKQILAAQTGGVPGVPGVDAKRPLGLVVQTNGADFIVAGYLPVVDLQKMLDWLQTRGVEPEKQGTAYRVDMPNGQSLFLAQKGDWAVISVSPEALDQASANPPQELDQLASIYDLGVAAYIGNIPPMWKQLGLAMIQQGVQTAMEQQPDQTDEQFAAQKAMIQRSFEQMQQAINEMDRILIGVQIDAAASVIGLDIETTILPGTQSAQELALNKNLKTKLAGFIASDATAALRETVKAGPRSITQFKDSLSQYESMINSSFDKDTNLKPREKKLLKQLLSMFFNSLVETVEKDQLDIAMSVKLDSKSCEGLMAMTLVNPEEVENTVAEILKQAAKDNPDFAKVLKLNAEMYKGVRLHVVELPADALKEAPQALKDIFGSNAGAVIGFSENLVCMAFGPNPVSILKNALDQSASEVAVDKIFEFSLAVKPLIEFVQVAASEEWGEEERQLAEQLLASAGTKDRVTMDGVLIENGSRVRIEFQEGVLKVLAQLVIKAVAQQGVGFAPGAMAP